MPLDQQIEVFAATVQNDPKLAGGFNAIGYSQGNLVIRGYIQRYNDPPVRRYVSMHGPHGGVSGFPSCNVSEPLCKYYAEFLGDLAYTRLAQKAIAPANYYRDPARVNAFIKGCTFLADLNQLSSFNSTYKQNMLSLEKVLLVKATEDEVVQPPVSAYFGYDVLAPDGSFEAVDGHTTPVFSNDTLGLSTLEKSGRVRLAERARARSRHSPALPYQCARPRLGADIGRLAALVRDHARSAHALQRTRVATLRHADILGRPGQRRVSAEAAAGCMFRAAYR